MIPHKVIKLTLTGNQVSNYHEKFNCVLFIGRSKWQMKSGVFQTMLAPLIWDN